MFSTGLVARLKNSLKHCCKGQYSVYAVWLLSHLYLPTLQLQKGEKISVGPSERKDMPKGLCPLYPADEIWGREKKCSFSPDMGIAVPSWGSLMQGFFLSDNFPSCYLIGLSWKAERNEHQKCEKRNLCFLLSSPGDGSKSKFPIPLQEPIPSNHRHCVRFSWFWRMKTEYNVLQMTASSKPLKTDWTRTPSRSLFQFWISKHFLM